MLYIIITYNLSKLITIYVYYNIQNNRQLYA